MDFITPLPATSHGNTGILVVVDRFSKMMHAIPTPSPCTAIATARLYHDYIYRYHGLPRTIVSDRDPIFMSHFWTNLFSMTGVRLTPSSSYHPQTDGQTEVVNKKIEEILRCFVDEHQRNWDQLLVDVEVAYNSAPHSATLYSPFFLNYGLHPRTIPMDSVTSINPSANDFLSLIQETTKSAYRALEKAQVSMVKFANRSRREHVFSINDLVLLSTQNLSLDSYSGARKLMPKYCGPFQVIRVINDVTVKLKLPALMLQRGIHDVFHVSNIRPYRADGKFERSTIPPPPLQLVDGTTEYEVEKVIRHRIRRNQTEYLVKWTGYPSHENTWQAASDLSNAQNAIADYRARVVDASASRRE
jgi:Chromo (CHRromatin Organisation MOdifier) domain